LAEPTILAVAFVALVAFGLFLERSFFSKGPIVSLAPFRKPTFVFACVFNLVIGFGLYASTYLVPVFLGRVRGYDALQIGSTVFIVGVTQVVSTVIAARLSQTVDPRKTITVGLILFALSLFMASAVTPDWLFAAWLAPQCLRGFAVMLCIVPSVGMALGAFGPSELRAASSLFNLMRNLGGAIGIAVVNTWLVDATRLHAVRLGEAMGRSGADAGAFVQKLSARLAGRFADHAEAARMARGELARVVARSALTSGFQDVFTTMGWMFILALVMIPFCRPAPSPPAAANEAH
jgi:DHA2 family multidrug resistance protein